MFIFLYIVVVGLLIGTLAIEPLRTTLGQAELNRRVAAADHLAKQVAERERQLGAVYALQQVIGGLLFVAAALLSVVAFGWLGGVLISLVVVLEANRVSRLRFVQHTVQRWYDKVEPSLLQLPTQVPWLFTLIGTVPRRAHKKQLDSREELQQLVMEANGFITSDEKQALAAALTAPVRLVSEVMTPRENISSIKKSELLGPLVLDDLHKTGHHHIPVIAGDLDHIIGILHMQNLLNIEKKRSLTAETAMQTPVYYIRDDQSLTDALAAFLQTHCQLLIVVNHDGETVGLVSLHDVLGALLGRVVQSEFDDYDDKQAVAHRSL